jgi:hypothetical protein
MRAPVARRHGALPPRTHFAGTRERAGTRRGRGPRSHAASLMEIGFAPEMTALSAIMPHIISCQRTVSEEGSMTAYLISLALIGLVAIAVAEGFS